MWHLRTGSKASRTLSRRLAGAFLRGGPQGRIHASFRIGLLAVAATVAFLSLAFGIYDSYAKKLETIALSVYPHLIVVANGQPSQTRSEEMSNDERCRRICDGETLFGDEQTSVGVSSKARISQVEALRRAVQQLDATATVAPILFEELDLRLSFGGPGMPSVARRVRVLGIDPRADRWVPEVDRFMSPELIQRLALSPDAVVLSEGLAKALAVGTLAEASRVTAETSAGKRHHLAVIGRFSLGFHTLAENMLVTSVEGAQRLLDMPEQASYFGVTLDDPFAATALRQELRRPLSELQLGASDWTSIASGDFANIRLFRWLLVLTLGMCLVITALGIRNTLAIVTVERRRQIGILRALGLRDGAIRWTFLWIALGLSAAGTLLGLPLGIVGSMVFGRWLDTALAGLLPIHGIAIGVHPESLLQIVGMVLLAAVLTARIAVRRALTLEPTHCLAAE